MAQSGVSHSIAQSLEKEAAQLTVEKLKVVLRHTNLPVSGNKPLLISRVKQELHRLVQTNNSQSFDRLRRLIQNPDRPPPAAVASPSPGYSSSPFASSPRFGAQAHSRGTYPTTSQYGSAISADMKFVESPFYTIEDKVSERVDLDCREHTRDTKDFSFMIKPAILDRLRKEKDLRVLMYCAVDDPLRMLSHVSFPTSFELRINSQEIRANFRGLKNKPGTTRPADVTAQLNMSTGLQNRVAIVWALTNKRHSVIFQLVRQHKPESLVKKLREAKSISKASVLQEMNRWASDSDIVATSSRMSLKCPLSTLRIQTPCRSKRCRHNQCFDALSFLQLQEQAPQWTCPVCNQNVPFDILQVDEYVDDILQNSPPSAEQVTIDPNGHWSLVKDGGNAENNTQPSIKREETELSDDIVEVSGPSNGSLLRTPSTSYSPFVNGSKGGSIESFSTTSAHSTAQKRPAPAVIDLTLDSDDDEDDLPIRPPAKRQHTDVNSGPWSQGHAANSQSQVHLANPVKFGLPPRPRGSLASDSAFPK